MVCASALVLGCDDVGAENLTPSASGIEGTVHVTPTRPGPIIKGAEAQVAPVRHTQFVVKAADAVIATFTTDAEGRFRVPLPAGRYVIMPPGRPPPIGRWRFEAEVATGRMTTVSWIADNGMR